MTNIYCWDIIGLMALTEAEKKKIEEEEAFRSKVRSTRVDSSENYGVPAILSFFLPGLGQLVKGQTKRGILIFLGWLFSFILIITIIGAVVPLIIYLWQIIDAYNKPAN